VARAAALPRSELRARYQTLFMETLSKVATPARQTNVLLHMFGHLKARLDGRDGAELRALIEDYRKGLVPLVVPVTLLKHHVARLGVPYLEGQVYLDPHPKELMLRNHV
jgi:uncharacterized protein YbgA (DUF1722 family)